jgi:hypothetical protein
LREGALGGVAGAVELWIWLEPIALAGVSGLPIILTLN